MIEEPRFYTKTMAKIYEEQGNFEKAAQIYKYLLDQDPDRQDIIEALAEIDKKISADEPKDESRLVSLFSEWLDLLFVYNKLQKLKNLRKLL